MAPTDVEELLDLGTTVLLAVDQAPFPVPKGTVVNYFSLLVPLITEGGVRLQADQETFPSRGRVWWMLRPEIDPASVRPGMIWSGRLELSQDYRSERQDKEWYQITRKTATPGNTHVLEILGVPDRDPDLGDLMAGGVPCAHSPLSRVLVRGPGFVTGPFRSCYDAAENRVSLEPLHSGDPWVYRCPRHVLDGAAEEFSLTGGRRDPYAAPTEFHVALLHERHLERLSGSGEKLDAATDVQVLNWGLKLLKVTKRDQQPVKDLLHRTEAVRDATAEMDLPGRRERFVGICRRLDTIVQMGIDVAEAIADQEGFRALLDRHKDALVQARVEEAVKKRQGEIEAFFTAEKERLDRIRSDIARLEDEFERRSKEQEEEFKKANEARLRDVAEREVRVTERENALLESERAMETRLARVIDAFRREGEAIGDQLLGQVLLLRRAGVLGGAEAESVERPTPLAMPVWLKKPRAKSGIDEARFMEQFEHVVTRRGFAFDHEDLVSFHVAVKTGFWTVLAGASGLGKTSLSRLYAEALGASEEHLLLPVRPDWLDDRDVIGAFNALSRRFEPAAGGLVERLMAAREDFRTGRGGIYLICLDEMNLSRVEHYFAAFLSVMESPEGRRELPLFGAGLESPGDPYAPFRVLSIGDNIRFIGTVNVDETTHFFSPKVLDRATIVTLSRPSLKEGRRGVSAAELGGLVPVHIDEYRSWIAAPSDASPEILDLLVKIDEILRASRSGIGYRVRNRILAFVASARHLIGEDKALDLALFSSVVPRLRRSGPGWERLIKDLRALLTPGKFPRTADVLSAMADEEGEFEFFLHL